MDLEERIREWGLQVESLQDRIVKLKTQIETDRGGDQQRDLSTDEVEDLVSEPVLASAFHSFSVSLSDCPPPPPSAKASSRGSAISASASGSGSACMERIRAPAEMPSPFYHTISLSPSEGLYEEKPTNEQMERTTSRTPCLEYSYIDTAIRPPPSLPSVPHRDLPSAVSSSSSSTFPQMNTGRIPSGPLTKPDFPLHPSITSQVSHSNPGDIQGLTSPSISIEIELAPPLTQTHAPTVPKPSSPRPRINLLSDVSPSAPPPKSKRPPSVPSIPLSRLLFSAPPTQKAKQEKDRQIFLGMSKGPNSTAFPPPSSNPSFPFDDPKTISQLNEGVERNCKVMKSQTKQPPSLLPDHPTTSIKDPIPPLQEFHIAFKGDGSDCLSGGIPEVLIHEALRVAQGETEGELMNDWTEEMTDGREALKFSNSVERWLGQVNRKKAKAFASPETLLEATGGEQNPPRQMQETFDCLEAKVSHASPLSVGFPAFKLSSPFAVPSQRVDSKIEDTNLFTDLHPTFAPPCRAPPMGPGAVQQKRVTGDHEDLSFPKCTATVFRGGMDMTIDFEKGTTTSISRRETAEDSEGTPRNMKPLHPPLSSFRPASPSSSPLPSPKSPSPPDPPATVTPTCPPCPPLFPFRLASGSEEEKEDPIICPTTETIILDSPLRDRDRDRIESNRLKEAEPKPNFDSDLQQQTEKEQRGSSSQEKAKERKKPVQQKTTTPTPRPPPRRAFLSFESKFDSSVSLPVPPPSPAGSPSFHFSSVPPTSVSRSKQSSLHRPSLQKPPNDAKKPTTKHRSPPGTTQNSTFDSGKTSTPLPRRPSSAGQPARRANTKSVAPSKIGQTKQSSDAKANPLPAFLLGSPAASWWEGRVKRRTNEKEACAQMGDAKGKGERTRKNINNLGGSQGGETVQENSNSGASAWMEWRAFASGCFRDSGNVKGWGGNGRGRMSIPVRSLPSEKTAEKNRCSTRNASRPAAHGTHQTHPSNRNKVFVTRKVSSRFPSSSGRSSCFQMEGDGGLEGEGRHGSPVGDMDGEERRESETDDDPDRASASIDEGWRRKTFRRLMVQWHPDKNPQNVEAATRVFQALQAARSRHQ
uniref:J domain-containing protein n=1 Tax=Chromera velia CCMP2878 TaxID=1169474 RepID=A0A0G4GCH0_9ALVE|eukprot:Cvel_21227.t1-p1 / transcript=Cvel_21227.t1 / gene=Cvel_21227 / organism=Chromera_velia_CCMP2878 / gene_product=hypothetical protein / transcript_product=hypothetical protein / location=Cvel_scaffold1973:26947-31966(-) / protein_length=1091 / sequence_SO=supercontig / SO=protein_coding / is_pseudo=false